MTFALPTPRIPDPKAAPELNWGIIGTGFIASVFALAVNSFSSGRIIAVGSRSDSKAKEFAAQFDIEITHDSYEALAGDPKVQAVYVATPHSEHLAHALLAIAAGKPVLVEKAFARNAKEAQQIVDAARQANVAVMEAMWTRFLPRTDIVRQLLTDGALGELHTFIADHGQSLTHVKRMTEPNLAGGALLDLGIYPISYSSFIFGSPRKVEASGILTDAGVDGQVSAVLSGYENYPQAQSILTTTMWAKTPTTAAICGGAARIELDGDFYIPGPVRLVNNAGQALSASASPLQAHQGLVYEAAHFAQLVADGRTESELMPAGETVAILGVLDEIRAQIGFTLPGE
ncbi:MAG: Gfo/Idh/MocA family oxidoreductase [Propionibacteriaceae bacterium]|jgi:predicted dehydrogenase|nr:Gfo/Idh/MocA family oxidoreductase [Propionibacteriaceae bacterium]